MLALVAALAASAQTPPAVVVPQIPFDSVPDYLKYPATMNLGEVLGVAVDSKSHLLVLNHPGSATSGPLYGNATTQLLEFDETGKRSEEHTSELQSRRDLVCRLLLEKKNVMTNC